MAFVAVDKDGSEWIYAEEPIRGDEIWQNSMHSYDFFNLPHGSIRKLIGRDLTWEDEPVELE